MKKICIYANGGEKNGLGHIMRTLVLAEELKKRFEVFYVCDDNEEYKKGIELLNKFGFEVRKFCCKPCGDMLITDVYTADNAFFDKQRGFFKKLMYIDDLKKLDFYNVDILLNKNIGAETLFYNIMSGGRLLLGGRYSLLREEFRNISEYSVNREVKNVLVTFGGSDVTNYSPILARLLKRLGFCVSVAIGASFSEKTINELKTLECENVKLFYSPDMAKMYTSCDLAVTACGGAMSELAALGVPSVGVAVAENQIEPMKAAIKKGAVVYGGTFENFELKKLENTIKKLSESFAIRKQLSESQKKCIDKNGVFYILNEIEEVLGK